MCVCALKIVCMDNILRFINNYYHHYIAYIYISLYICFIGEARVKTIRDRIRAVSAVLAVSSVCAIVLFQNKRISAKDALAHPYIDEGRLRFHSCMCTCCAPQTAMGQRQFCSECEPECPTPFNHDFEDQLTSVTRVRGECAVGNV